MEEKEYQKVIRRYKLALEKLAKEDRESNREIMRELTRRYSQIECVEGVLGGKPKVKDRRISVLDIQGMVISSEDFDNICEDFDVTREQIKESLMYVKELMELIWYGEIDN